MITPSCAEPAQPAKPLGSAGIAGSAGCARWDQEEAGALTAGFAQTALAVAGEVNRAEERLRDAILEAARHGDCARVERIALAWRDMPALDALKAIQD